MRFDLINENDRKLAEIVFKKKGGHYLTYINSKLVTNDVYKERAKLIYGKLADSDNFERKQSLNDTLIEKILMLDDEAINELYKEKYGEKSVFQTDEDYLKDSEELLIIIQKKYSNAILNIDENLVLNTIYEYGQLCIEKEEKRLIMLEA